MSYSKYTDPDEFTLKQHEDMVNFLDDTSIGDKFCINEEEVIYTIDSLPTYPRYISDISKTHNRYIELITSSQKFFIAYNNNKKSVQPELFLVESDGLEKHYSYVYSICTNPIPTITTFDGL